MKLATRTWPASGHGTLCLAHANGFSKELWGPVVDELRKRGEPTPAVAWDFPSHGQSPKASHPIDWWSLGAAAGRIAEAQPAPRIGVGHSMGSAALIMAQIANPELFVRLILIEPIVFPGPYRRMDSENAMAKAARRRRRHFVSKEEALEKFGSKAVFARWTADALAAYVEGGLARSGDGWILACLPEDEAELYETAGAHGVYELLREVQVPTLVVAGEHSDTHPPAYTEHLAQRFANGRPLVVPDTTHFVPMEAPGVVADIIIAESRATA